MSDIDRQRISAVRVLEGMGYVFRANAWSPPPASPVSPIVAEADALHGILMELADKMAGCPEGSDDEATLGVVATVLEAYEQKRWPSGKVPGGKG